MAAAEEVEVVTCDARPEATDWRIMKVPKKDLYNVVSIAESLRQYYIRVVTVC